MVKRLTQLFAKQPYAGSNPTRASMERDKSEIKSKDETGFSEKHLDIDVEIGALKRKKIKKTLFKKKGS